MTGFAILDTSILVDQLRTGRHQQRIDSISVPIRTSAVVLAELWRGASDSSDQRILAALERNHPVLTPTQANWIESGRLLNQIRIDCRFDGAKLRNLHFDVLIALTARSFGARLITANRADFELILRYRKFELEVW